MDKVITVDMSKAGMQTASAEAVSNIVNEASRGSPFYEREQKRAEQRQARISALKASVAGEYDDLCSIPGGRCVAKHVGLKKSTDEKELDLWERCLQETPVSWQRIADYLNETPLETSRVTEELLIPSFFGIYAHIDLDMFFAAVEEKLNPELQGIPFAVGGMSMLSTSNYEARKYGVRAAMPGYVAKKLCPQLVLVSGSYGRYTEESESFKEVVREVDPHFHSWGLDEASINLLPRILLNRKRRNESCNVMTNFPSFLEEGAQIVSEIRGKFKSKSGLTSSGGIAVTRSLAKIMSNKNKPNGQYTNAIEGWKEAMPLESLLLHLHKTVSVLKCRDISGIGKVSDEFLQAFGIHTVGDLYMKRYLVQRVLTLKTADNLLQTSLGLMGSGNEDLIEEAVLDESAIDRKSLAVDRTFFRLDTKEQLLQKRDDIVSIARRRLEKERLAFKQVTLRLKHRNFEVHQFTKTLPGFVQAVSSSEVDACPLASTVRELLQPFEDQYGDFRLMGVRVGRLCLVTEINANVEPSTKKKQQKTLEQVSTSKPSGKQRGKRSRSPEVIEVDENSVEIIE